MTKQQIRITKQDINALAAPLKFPFDHSKQEVQNLDKLFELVQVCFELEQILLGEETK